MGGKVIIGLSNSVNLAKSIAKLSKSAFLQAELSKFPDGETYLRLPAQLNGKEVFIVESMHPDPNGSFVKLIFSGKTAKDLNAAKIHAIIPYLAYMRQDIRFKPGESISSKYMAESLDFFDSVITMDTHLHRYKKLSDVFKAKAMNLSASEALASYILKNFKKSTLIGPDIESRQWVKSIADKTSMDFFILLKERISPRKVLIKPLNLNLKGKKLVIVDDVVSTGGTIIEAAKMLKKQGAESIIVVCTHGIFSEKALKKMRAAGINQIISTNSISSSQSRIDVSPVFAKIIAGH